MCKKFSETYDRLESALSTAPSKRSLEEEESACSPGKRARTESAPAAGLTEGKGQEEAADVERPDNIEEGKESTPADPVPSFVEQLAV